MQKTLTTSSSDGKRFLELTFFECSSQHYSRMTVLFSISVSNHAIFPNSLFCFAFRSIPHSSAPNDSWKSEFHISGRRSSVHSDLLSSFYLEIQLRIPFIFHISLVGRWRQDNLLQPQLLLAMKEILRSVGIFKPVLGRR